MATISAADLTLLRQQRQSARLYLSVLQPATLLAARVNNIAITRGARSIAYDTGTGSGFATIESGHTLLVGTAAGTYDVGTVRVKSIAGAQAAGTITVDENSIDWVDDLYLTVLHEYRIWPAFPRVDRATGIYYKFYSTTYTDENLTPNPVALVGFPTYAGFLSGGSIAIALNAGNSYVTAQGAAIASYAWVCVHNGGSTANISFSDTATNTSAIQNPTLTISAADTYWLKLTVTDDNGKTQSTYRPLFIYADSTGPYRNFTVSNLSGDWNSAGWSFNVEVFGNVALSDFPDGTFALLWYQNYFNSVEDYVNLWDRSNEIVCSGYIQRETDDDDLAETGTGNVSFTVVSPTGVLANKSISPGTVSLEYTAAPTLWWQYANLTAGRGVHHLLKWQSTVMETCEVIGLLNNTILKYVIEFTEDSLLDMINNFAYDRGHFAKLCANRLGELHFVSDIQYYNDADRAAEDTIFSIAAQDLSGTIQLSRAPVKTTAFAFMDGVDFDGTPPGTPYTFVVPAYNETYTYERNEPDGQGGINKTVQIIASETDGQEKCGRVLAVANNPLREMRLDLRANYLGAFDIIPNQGWYSWGLANADLKRSLSLNSTKWLCRRVEIRQTLSGDLFSGDITTGVVLEGEAFGPDALTIDYPTSYPTQTLPTPNWSPDLGGGTYAYLVGGRIVAWVVTADRTDLSTGTTAANAVSNLSVARDWVATVSDAATYGYFAGGRPSGVTDTAVTDRITFSTGVTAANAVSNLSVARYGADGVSDGATYGYFAGGFDVGVGVVATADRITFASGVTAANAGSNLSTARYLCGPVSDGSTYGYWGGGSPGVYQINQTQIVDVVTFSTGNTVLLAAALSSQRSAVLSVNGATYGYFMGGDNSGSAQSTTDEITFATRAIAAHAAADFTTASDNTSGASSSTYGYAPKSNSTFDRITFATRVNAVTANTMSDGRLGYGAVSDGHV